MPINIVTQFGKNSIKTTQIQKWTFVDNILPIVAV